MDCFVSVLNIFTFIVGIKSIRHVNFVKHGGTATLNCSSSNSKSVSWRHAGIVYSIGNQINKQLSPNKYAIIGNHLKGQYNLRIKNIDKRDEGLYWCVSNSDFDTADVLFEVKLMIPPSALTILNQSQNMISSEVGRNMSLTCIVKSGLPPGTLFWYRNNKILVRGNGKVVYNFTTTDTDHLQTFVCKATHKALEKDLESAVQITFPRKPVVTLKVHPQNAMIGEDVTFSCKLDNPISLTNIDWMKNGEILHLKTTEIVIANITSQDMGIYTCRVANKFGNSSSSYFLKVSGFVKPSTHITASDTRELTTDGANSTRYRERLILPDKSFKRNTIYYGLSAIVCILFIGSIISFLTYQYRFKCMKQYTVESDVNINNRLNASGDETSSYEEIDDNQLVLQHSRGDASVKTNSSSSRNGNGTLSNSRSLSSVVIRPTFDSENYLNPYHYLGKQTEYVHSYSALSSHLGSDNTPETEIKHIDKQEGVSQNIKHIEQQERVLQNSELISHTPFNVTFSNDGYGSSSSA